MPVSALAAVIDLVFAPRCACCRGALPAGGGEPFCAACRRELHVIAPPLCTRCGVPFPVLAGEDHLCGECLLREPPFAIARSLGRYEGTLLHAIHEFKYRGRVALGEALGALMAGFSFPSFSPAGYSLVVPVPLHTARLRRRMFNQAVILGRSLANGYGLPLAAAALVRSVATEPQVALGRSERAANVAGAFTVSAAQQIEGRGVILVDDVFTTGSTATECARVLKQGGAERVAVLTLARAVARGDRAGDDAL